jgi:uncharacterized protein (DUF934 family)
LRVIKAKERAIVEDDWRILPDGEAPQGNNQADNDQGKGQANKGKSAVIVPFARYLAEGVALTVAGGRVAILLRGDQDLDALAPHLSRLPLIAIDFPKFTDGRGYSLARLLRERYAYCGELRAVGDVLRDQLFYMARCGFDSFALRQDKDWEDALRAFDDFSVKYQPAADEPLPLYRRR